MRNEVKAGLYTAGFLVLMLLLAFLMLLLADYAVSILIGLIVILVVFGLYRLILEQIRIDEKIDRLTK